MYCAFRRLARSFREKRYSSPATRLLVWHWHLRLRVHTCEEDEAASYGTNDDHRRTRRRILDGAIVQG